jgi:hypothetical protein
MDVVVWVVGLLPPRAIKSAPLTTTSVTGIGQMAIVLLVDTLVMQIVPTHVAQFRRLQSRIQSQRANMLPALHHAVFGTLCATAMAMDRVS